MLRVMCLYVCLSVTLVYCDINLAFWCERYHSRQLLGNLYLMRLVSVNGNEASPESEMGY